MEHRADAKAVERIPIRSIRMRASAGFTLVEVLAALAIASVIILATVGLTHNLVLSFDRGTTRVSGGERLVLAADRLATDIGAARFILQSTPAGSTVAFLGAPTKITFIGAGGIDPGLRTDRARAGSEEVVSVSVEVLNDTTSVIRRRAPWTGLNSRLDNVLLRDDVVLVKGQFDAAFSFARMSPEGKITWVNSWTGEKSLPRLVKLSLRVGGIDLLGGAEFAIHANAPSACARAGSGVSCVGDAGAGQSEEGGTKSQAPGQQPDQDSDQDADQDEEGASP